MHGKYQDSDSLLRELSIFTGRGPSLCGGGPEFFGVVKGGGTRFSLVDQIFFMYAKGGTRKIGDRPSQTDGRPPAGKK